MSSCDSRIVGKELLILLGGLLEPGNLVGFRSSTFDSLFELLLVGISSSKLSIDFLDDLDFVGCDPSSFSFGVEFWDLKDFTNLSILVPPIFQART